jgi:hypothetical protein
MFPSSLGQLKSKEAARSRFAPTPEMPRRTLQGGTAMTTDGTGSERVNLYQPQDGATVQRRRVTDIASRLLKLSAGEPEDARLTGGTRSLMRRLSGLNLVQFARPASSRATIEPRSAKPRSAKPGLPDANVA